VEHADDHVVARRRSRRPVPPNPPLPEDAQALVKKLTDPDAAKRLDAIQRLGHMARRVDRTVYRRCDWRDLYALKVKGLVPHLNPSRSPFAKCQNSRPMVDPRAEQRRPPKI
jgi:hypothetical protein